jgi:hypothetical protein
MSTKSLPLVPNVSHKRTIKELLFCFFIIHFSSTPIYAKSWKWNAGWNSDLSRVRPVHQELHLLFGHHYIKWLKAQIMKLLVWSSLHSPVISSLKKTSYLTLQREKCRVRDEGPNEKDREYDTVLSGHVFRTCRGGGAVSMKQWYNEG